MLRLLPRQTSACIRPLEQKRTGQLRGRGKSRTRHSLAGKAIYEDPERSNPPACEQFSHRVRENGEGTITSIYMHPELETVRDVSNLAQRVDRACVHRSCITNYAEWNIAGVQVSSDFCHEIVHPHSEAFVDCDVLDVLPADSQKRRCLDNREMRGARRIQAQAP